MRIVHPLPAAVCRHAEGLRREARLSAGGASARSGWRCSIRSPAGPRLMPCDAISPDTPRRDTPCPISIDLSHDHVGDLRLAQMAW